MCSPSTERGRSVRSAAFPDLRRHRPPGAVRTGTGARRPQGPDRAAGSGRYGPRRPLRPPRQGPDSVDEQQETLLSALSRMDSAVGMSRRPDRAADALRKSTRLARAAAGSRQPGITPSRSAQEVRQLLNDMGSGGHDSDRAPGEEGVRVRSPAASRRSRAMPRRSMPPAGSLCSSRTPGT